MFKNKKLRKSLGITMVGLLLLLAGGNPAVKNVFHNVGSHIGLVSSSASDYDSDVPVHVQIVSQSYANGDGHANASNNKAMKRKINSYLHSINNKKYRAIVKPMSVSTGIDNGSTTLTESIILYKR